MFTKYKKISDLENLRDELARTHKHDMFRKSYNLKVNGLKDINTGVFWDKKNVEEYKELVASPIFRDKVNLISGWLLKKKGKLLDIGFGSAEIERKLQNSNLELLGIDISSRAVARAREKYKGNYRKGNIYEIPFPSGTFDVILALDILEHLPAEKVFRAYSEIWRVLKKGGLFVASVPLNENLQELLNKKRNPNGHLRIYTPNILRTEHDLSGFEIFGEKYLYAFKKFYFIKKIILKIFFGLFRRPNLIITFAVKK